MAIRVVQYEDWERARDLRLRALADAPDAFARSLEEEERLSESEWRDFVSTSDSRVWFVEATDDDELVGMAFGFLDDPAKTAYLGGMWVEPGGRRSGIGKRLVESVVEWARARGAVRIELEVNELTRRPRCFGNHRRRGRRDRGGVTHAVAALDLRPQFHRRSGLLVRLLLHRR